MAERAAPEDRDPAGRGRLLIHDRVVETIACAAATEIDGVQRSGGSLEGVVGRRYPKAHASTAGSRTRIGIEVAVVWPTPLAQLLGQVREHVRTRVVDLTGLDVDAVDVVAARIVQDTPERPRRVT